MCSEASPRPPLPPHRVTPRQTPRSVAPDLVSVIRPPRSPATSRLHQLLPDLADPLVVTVVSCWPFPPSPFSSSHAVATAPSSTAPAAACASRRRGPGNQTARASCPTCSPPRVVAVGAMNALPRPLQPRSHKHPNASAAPSSFPASSVRPRCCRIPLWMRASPSSPRVPSSARLGAGGAIPSPPAASAAAGG